MAGPVSRDSGRFLIHQRDRFATAGKNGTVRIVSRRTFRITEVSRRPIPGSARNGHYRNAAMNSFFAIRSPRWRTAENRWGYRKAKRLGGLEVDDHLEFYRQLDGQLRRFRAAQDAIA
jgi:hypothetical protein